MKRAGLWSLLMTKIAPPKFLSRGALALLGVLLVSMSAPAQAQDGLLMRNLFGKIGILPEEKDPIEYRERPALVVPKDTNVLRTPEPAGAAARNSAWPVDPDVAERAREKARRNLPVFAPLKADAGEGNRLKLDELARGRSARGAQMGETGVPRNDRDGVLASVQEMTAGSKLATTPSYPPGTEPPRKYLTDPPPGLRIPSAGAAVGKRTQDGPVVDNFRVGDAWKRLE